jgi:protein CpxP
MRYRGFLLQALLLAAALCVGVMVGRAQTQAPQGKPHQFGRNRAGGRMNVFSQLNLTDAQKAQIQQIRAKYQDTFKNIHTQVRNLHENRAAGFETGGTVDDNAIRQAILARANAEADMAIAHAHMMSEIYNTVLTDDQKAQLAQLRQQRQQQRELRKQQFQQRRQAQKPSASVQQ